MGKKLLRIGALTVLDVDQEKMRAIAAQVAAFGDEFKHGLEQSGLLVRGLWSRSGKPITKEDAQSWLNLAAITSDKREREEASLVARLLTGAALANRESGLSLRGRPRRKKIDDTAMHERMRQISRDTGEVRPYRLARLALGDAASDSGIERLARDYRF